MKKYPHGLTLNAVCAAIEDYQRHEDGVPEEGILAAFNTLLGHSDIAEAFRSLEEEKQAAEAKLAELEKRRSAASVFGWLRVVSGQSFQIMEGAQRPPDRSGNGAGPWFAIYRQPPAVNLAELVPDGWKLVPVEPTEEMVSAGDQFMDGLSRLSDAYDAMLAAAPEVE